MAIVKLDDNDRNKLLDLFQKLTRSRAQYARITRILENVDIDFFELASLAQGLRDRIDEFIKDIMLSLSDDTQDFSILEETFKRILFDAEALAGQMSLLSEIKVVPAGIHPDDWAWIKDVCEKGQEC